MNDSLFASQAPLTADAVLLLEMAMGAGLLVGAWLARAKRYRQHAWCQSAVVVLNFAVIAVTMAPSFRAHVLPRVPAKLSRPYFAWATAHAALGSITELAALYILLAAGTSFLPERLRITRYKLWMRCVVALWWLTMLLGFTTYARWYAPNLFR